MFGWLLKTLINGVPELPSAFNLENDVPLSLSYLSFSFRALWFVLEILMAKNENNSHAFIRKMVENIKQTKDGQCPDDPKINEVRLVSE